MSFQEKKNHNLRKMFYKKTFVEKLIEFKTKIKIKVKKKHCYLYFFNLLGICVIKIFIMFSV